MAKFTQDELKSEGYESSVIWHGVDHNLFKPIDKTTQYQIRQAYGFKNDDIILFNYGRGSPRKNNQTLIEAAYLICDKNPKVKCLFHITDNRNIGVCDVKDFVERVLVKKYGKNMWNKQLIFTDGKGKSDQEIANMIQMSDICFSSTIGEGFSLLYAEAMGCKKPVITNEYTTSKELLIESYNCGQRGLVVKPVLYNTSSFNVEHGYIRAEDLANTILDFIKTNKFKNNTYGKNGRKFVEKYLTWDNIANQFDKEFKEMI
jgi:glycosyltransferase involved in cell wall biosynthesis